MTFSLIATDGTVASPRVPGPTTIPASSRPMILVEINELCPSLIHAFMSAGLLPAFQRFYDASTIYTTDADEDEQNLEPWIQWPTVHSGMSFAEHGIFHLGDGRDLAHDGVATVLSNTGLSVGVFGSMNTNYGVPEHGLSGYFVPDPWDRDGRPTPRSLTPFVETIARQVRESSAEEDMSFSDKAGLGWFLLKNGLSTSTVAAIAKQLMAEKRDPELRWRRALLLDRIQYDVFRRLNRQFDVRFATFFSNATAHFQHYFWRHMDPEAFDAPPPKDDPASYEGAIFEGYKANDRLLARLMHDYPDAVLVLAGALSQQPWTETTKCTYRPRAFDELLCFAGIDPEVASVKPVMAEQFHVDFVDEASAIDGEARLEALSSNGERLLYVERDGARIFSGCRFESEGEACGAVVTRADGRRLEFGQLFHRVHTTRSGRHHPDGVLWIRGGVHDVVPGKVALTRVAPTILQHFGVEAPAHMRAAPLPYARVM